MRSNETLVNNYEIIEGDSLESLKGLPDNSVDCCITSPPYYGLRDYGTGTWVGGDPTCPHKRLNKISKKNITGQKREEVGAGVCDAIYKTVCPLCGAVREDRQIGLEETPEEYIEKLVNVFREVKRVLKDDGTLWVNIGDSYIMTKPDNEYKLKDLIGIPWMLAFALRKDGWYLRQDIIWSKPNSMPEAVKDRCTKAHEYIFLLSKKQNYYFDYEAIEEPVFDNGLYDTRHKRDVWTVSTKPYKEAHFATFPEELIEPMILAGCPVGGTILDPFSGSGTTGEVALKHKRKYIGIELNHKYVLLSIKRIEESLGNVVETDEEEIKVIGRSELW